MYKVYNRGGIIAETIAPNELSSPTQSRWNIIETLGTCINIPLIRTAFTS